MKRKLFIIPTIFFYLFIFSGLALAVDCEGGYKEVSGICVPSDTGLSEKPIAEIVLNVAGWLASLIGIIALIGFFISAIMYFTSAGDQTRAEKAKKAMFACIIGVIIALAGSVILQAVENILNATPEF